ncbi:MAG: DUF4886 domain-containing protein [Maribacter sp.]|uniref:DUF4886 domain-containing protein n=1 Tax=Maribacter sp. TaxID=1897614 RepID=UPI00329733A1
MKTPYTFLVRLKLVLLLSFSLSSCAQQEDSGKLQNEKAGDVSLGKEEVLFIGNSHTYYNQGMSTHLRNFRDSDDLKFDPIIQEIAIGGYTLQDHLGDQATIDKINERSWDVIILQENTAVASEALSSSVNAMQSFSEMVKPKGTKVFLFMTWPYKDRPEMLTGIRKTYQNGVLATSATLVPVGLEWQLIDQNQEVDIDLYDADGVHARLEGTFYAAAMCYRAIYDKSTSNNTYQAGLTTEIANYLKAKAD